MAPMHQHPGRPSRRRRHTHLELLLLRLLLTVCGRLLELLLMPWPMRLVRSGLELLKASLGGAKPRCDVRPLCR